MTTLPTCSTWFEKRDIRFRIHRHGTPKPSGPACLLVHGTAEGAFVWHDLVSALASQLCMYTIDLRGHGDSSWDPKGDYYFEKYVSDVRDIIAHLEEKEIFLVGHSLGADIVGCLAPELGQRLQGLVIVDSGPRIDPSLFQMLAEQLAASIRPYVSAEEYASALKQQRLFTPTSVIDRLARDSLRRGEDGKLHLKFDPKILNSLMSPQLVDRWPVSLAGLAAPVLVIRGSASAVLTQAVAARLAALAPRGSVTTIPHAGHAIMTDNGPAVEAVLRSFLLD